MLIAFKSLHEVGLSADLMVQILESIILLTAVLHGVFGRARGQLVRALIGDSRALVLMGLGLHNTAIYPLYPRKGETDSMASRSAV
jgi:hypothetical protein